MPTRSLPVRLSLGSEPSTDATVVIADWTMMERLRRGVMVMALCWCVGGLTIAIPGLHFILPPLLLLLGPILFVWRVMTASSFKECVGPCPRCKAERTMSMGGKVEPETNVFCDGCGNQLTLKLQR